jgi:hypothetical protein
VQPAAAGLNRAWIWPSAAFRGEVPGHPEVVTVARQDPRMTISRFGKRHGRITPCWTRIRSRLIIYAWVDGGRKIGGTAAAIGGLRQGQKSRAGSVINSMDLTARSGPAASPREVRSRRRPACVQVRRQGRLRLNPVRAHALNHRAWGGGAWPGA